MADPNDIAKAIAKDLGLPTSFLGMDTDYVGVIQSAVERGYQTFLIKEIIGSNPREGISNLRTSVRNLDNQNKEIENNRGSEAGRNAAGLGTPEEILRPTPSSGGQPNSSGAVNNQAPTPSTGAIKQLLLNRGFTENDLAFVDAQGLVNLAQDLGLIGIPRAGGSGPAGPSEGDKLRSALANFDPTRDLVKLGTGNKYFNKITGETIDLFESDPTKFQMVTGPDGTPTGYMVNDKGQSIDIGARALAQATQNETIRANKAREAQGDKGLDLQGRQVGISERGQTETERANRASEAETQRRNDLEQANIIANMQANPGKWVQREYTIANMLRPSGINEPSTYTGPTVSSMTNSKLAADQAEGARQAALINSGQVKPPGPVSGAITLNIGEGTSAKYAPPIAPTTSTGIVSQQMGSGSYETPAAPEYIETPNTTFDDGSVGTGYSVSQEDFDSMLAAIPGYAMGTNGMTTEGKFMVGDQQAHQQGLPGANPEIITNPTNAPIGVEPVQGAIGGMMGSSEGQPQEKQVASPTKIISQVMALLDKLPGDSDDIAKDVGNLLIARLDKGKIDAAVSNMKGPSSNSAGPVASSMPAFAYGTGYSYGATDPSAVGSSLTNSPLLTGLTTTPEVDTQNLPSIDYLRGGESKSGPAAKNFTGAFGTSLPEFNAINYGRYLDLRSDPATFGLLSSLYASGSRNLEGEASRAKKLAPIGNAMRNIRT